MDCPNEADVRASASTFSGSVNDYYPNGIIHSSYNDMYDKTKFSWNNAAQYLSSLTTSATGSYYKTNIPNDTDTAAQLETKYNNISNGIKAEYCWYMTRYRNALNLLIGTLTTPNTKQGDLLVYVKEVNARLNAMTELVSVIAEQAAARTNQYNSQINSLNNQLAQSRTLQDQTQFLQNSDSLLTTRKEMIRYTAEKNNHITNQISLWAALNILAIGTIFAIYRSM